MTTEPTLSPSHGGWRAIRDEHLALRYFYFQVCSAKERYSQGEMGHGAFINAIYGAIRTTRVSDMPMGVALSISEVVREAPEVDPG